MSQTFTITDKIYIVIKNIGMYIMILLGIVGFSSYFMKQYKDHSENFNYGTFLLGTNKCSGLK